MEQLILKMTHQVDQANGEKEQAKVELDMERIEKIRIEEKQNYLREQYDQLKE